jgi:outer membrane receptor for ferrienterochelin and colicins
MSNRRNLLLASILVVTGVPVFAETDQNDSLTLRAAAGIQLAQAAPASSDSPPSNGSPLPAVPNQTNPSSPDDESDQPSSTARRRQRPDQQIDRTEIYGTRSDNDQRRLSTAAKIVVGREEIERYGDSTLDEVLKRLPGISIQGRTRRGGSVVMRGLGNGYTQILINGERIPPGFSIDQLVPEQVERIEIYRAPTAETGARAIAGTINIVLREALRIKIDEVRVQVGEEAGRGQSNVSWIRNDQMGENGTYNVTLSAAQTNFFTQTATRRLFTDIPTGDVQLDQDLDANQIDQRNNVHFTSRLQWNLAPGEQLILQPFFTVSSTRTEILGSLNQLSGLAPAPYTSSESQGSADSDFGRLTAQWSKQFGPGTKLEIHASVGGFVSETQALLDENMSGARVLTQYTSTDIYDHSENVTGKFTFAAPGGNSIVTGGEFERVDRTQSQNTEQNGVPLLSEFGTDIRASVTRGALYAQDDWEPAQDWAANAGFRWEGIQTLSDNLVQRIDNQSSVFTPLAHAVWRFDQPDRDQVRFSLTESYRTPTLTNLIALPTVNPLYPITETNVESAPDSVGNPNLKPELAKGIDIALEHYTLDDGIASISFFARRIHDLIRNVTTLDDVVYSKVPRWVTEPINFGDASTEGIELDAKMQLNDLIKNALPITVHGNLSIYHSNVDDVVGPYNRLNQQPGLLGNLGADYKFQGAPWTVGGNVSWTPPYTVQMTNDTSTYTGLRRQIDAYALWTVNADTKLRFSVTNLDGLPYLTDAETVQGNQSQNVLSQGRTTTLISVRLERKL